MLAVLQAFPPPADDPLERRNIYREMLHVIDALCPDVHPENVKYALKVGRFLDGLNPQEKELTAHDGYAHFSDGSPRAEGGHTKEEMEYFWHWGYWRGEWRVRALSVAEVKAACILLLSMDETEGKPDAEKEYFAVHGVWPGAPEPA